MLVDLALITFPTSVLAHVTYLNTYKDTPREEWPHRRLVFHCVRHGRYLIMWATWQACSLLPLRHVQVHEEEQD